MKKREEGSKKAIMPTTKLVRRYNIDNDSIKNCFEFGFFLWFNKNISNKMKETRKVVHFIVQVVFICIQYVIGLILNTFFVR